MFMYADMGVRVRVRVRATVPPCRRLVFSCVRGTREHIRETACDADGGQMYAKRLCGVMYAHIRLCSAVSECVYVCVCARAFVCMHM